MSEYKRSFIDNIKYLIYVLFYDPHRRSLSFFMKMDVIVQTFQGEKYYTKQRKRMKKRSERNSDLKYQNLLKKRQKQLLPNHLRD